MTTEIFASGLFAGKVVLIVGAGGGVGRACAGLLARLGAALALSDSNGHALAQTAQASGAPAGYFAALLRHYPQAGQARFITPDEVAAYIAFLLSPAAMAVSAAAVAQDFALTAGY